MDGNRRYEWLLFDADDTLLDFHRSEHDALADTLAVFGIPSTEECIGIYSRINDALWKKLERGEVTKDRLRVRRYEEFCAVMGYGADPERMARTYEDFLATKHFLLPGAFETCARLAPDYKMYVITNGIAQIQRSRWAACGLAPFFRGCFISGVIGAEKPSPAFFAAVRAAVPELDPARTLVVGDSLTSDIRGGRNLGADTCWLDRKGKGLPEGASATRVIREIGELPGLLEAAESGR